MSVACLLITYLPIKYEHMRYPTLRRQPMLLVKEASGRRHVYDYSPEATGVSRGMPLEQALAKCPGAHVIECDMNSYINFWQRVLDSLEGRSPTVEDADLGVAYIDLKGLEGIYGSEANLIKAVSSAAPAAYLPRTGVAANKFLAYVAALTAEPERASRVEGDASAYLARHPVNILPTSHAIKERLAGFGLTKIGEIAKLSIGAMQGEFGREGAKLWKLSHGIDDNPVLARSHEETFEVASELPAPTAVNTALMIAVESLLHQLFSKADMKGRRARSLTLEARIQGMPTFVKRFVFREPMSDPRMTAKLVGMRMEDVSIPGPAESLTVRLTDITGESGRQESLFYDIRRREQLDEEIEQLEARLGEKPPIYTIREVEPWSRIPERRMALVPYAR